MKLRTFGQLMESFCLFEERKIIHYPLPLCLFFCYESRNDLFTIPIIPFLDRRPYNCSLRRYHDLFVFSLFFSCWECALGRKQRPVS
jgi:hypothetical protein